MDHFDLFVLPHFGCLLSHLPPVSPRYTACRVNSWLDRRGGGFNRNPTPQIAGVAPVATASAASKPHHRASTRPPFPSARCAFWVRQQEPRFATIPEYAATGGLWRDGPSGPGLFQQLQRLVLRQAFVGFDRVIILITRFLITMPAVLSLLPVIPLAAQVAGLVGMQVAPAWSAPLVSAGQCIPNGLAGHGLACSNSIRHSRRACSSSSLWTFVSTIRR